MGQRSVRADHGRRTYVSATNHGDNRRARFAAISAYGNRKGGRAPAIRVEGLDPLQDYVIGVLRKVTRMSALPPKADICGAVADVRFGPIADIGPPQRNTATRGRITLISVNSPGGVSTSIDPPCCLTMMSWLMESPSPVPSPVGLVVKNGLNIFSLTAGV
jgi:hypothetical protein